MKAYLQIVAVLVVLATFVGFLVYRGLSETEPGPCSATGFPLRCYLTPPKACEVVWSSADTICKEYIKKLALAPGRLTGPITAKCKLAIFDNAFAVSRGSTPECQAQFKVLQEWKMRNDFR